MGVDGVIDVRFWEGEASAVKFHKLDIGRWGWDELG